MEGRPHFSFFWWSEPGTGARPSLQKMWREKGIGIADFSYGNEGLAGFFFSQGKAKKKPKKFEQVLGRAYRKCGGSTALFFFFGCLNLEQVLGRAYRKCGGWTALFFFFWVSEPGTGARPSLQKMWTVDRTFHFLVDLNFEQVPVRAYRYCGERG